MATIKVPEIKDFAEAGKDLLKAQSLIPNVTALVFSSVFTMNPLVSTIAILITGYTNAVWSRLSKV